MDVTEDVTCTLRAESHHPPCVMESAGFCTEHSAKAGGIGYEEETAPTLRAGTVPAAVMFENHSQDTRYRGPLETAPTVSSTYGTGGNNQPFVVERPKCYDVRFTSEGTKNARQNCYETETARTIDTGGNAPDSNQGGVAVVYGICSKDSNSMKSDNPHSGFYEAETARTLDANGGNPSCNQGGMAVVALQGSMIGRKDKNGPQGSGINEDVSFTLNATDKHAVVYAIDRETFNCGQNFARNLGIKTDGINPTLNAQGPSAVAQPVYCTSKNSHHTIAEKELANTLVATDYKDPPCVAKEEITEPHYIVRRLTPTECARLQGFPDWWCADLGIENPTDEDLEFWREVFETHRKIMGTSSKPKTDKQIIKWLKNPHSDSAEYKMWGNGIFLGNAYFVLSGIVYYSQFPDFLL
jgi:DNA (cytosine-5)-methyltransferase 1